MKIPLLMLISPLILTQISLSGPIDRIVGGDNATIEEHPYQVMVEISNWQHCGGSILNKFYILTAAHCFKTLTVDNYTIRAGTSLNNADGIIRQVAKKFCHPQYNDSTHDYDICILKLEHPLTFNKKIGPIRLPKQNVRNDSVDNLIGTVTGWGRLQTLSDVPQQLQMVKLPTWTQDECKRIMSKHGFVITDRMFCAGYHKGGKDACKGDSGGPMVAEGVIIGITSFGRQCAFKDSPGAYVRVSYFVNYINSIISKI